MSIFEAWTTDQWIIFAALSVAGSCAVGLGTLGVRIVRGWTAPATSTGYRAAAPAARPTLALAARRTPMPIAPAMHETIADNWHAARTFTLPPGSDTTIIFDVIDVDPTSPGAVPLDSAPAYDPAKLDFSPGGMASATAIAAVPADPTLVTSAERAAELDAWINGSAGDIAAAFGRIERGFNARLAPAMLKAIMWAIEGEAAGVAGSGRLIEWHMDTPSGAWPMIVPVGATLPPSADAFA